MSKKVAVIMGSDSDLPEVKGALDELDKNLPETRRKTASV